MVKQSHTLCMISLLLITSANHAVESRKLLSLSQEELAQIARNPEASYVYVTEDVRDILSQLANKSAPKAIQSVVESLTDTYKMAPKADMMVAVEAALATCKNQKNIEVLESYKTDLLSGELSVCGIEEDREITRKSGKNKCRFCSLFVSNCLNAGNVSVCNNAKVSGTLSAGNIVDCGDLSVAGCASVSGNSTVGGCETVKGDVVFGPCGLHVRGSNEPNLLSVRGTISLTCTGSGLARTLTASATRGCGFTVPAASTPGIPNFAPITLNTCPSGSPDTFSTFGFSVPVCFCSTSKFLCPPSITLGIEPSPMLIGTPITLTCRPGTASSVVVQNVTAFVTNVSNTTIPTGCTGSTGGFVLNVLFQVCGDLSACNETTLLQAITLFCCGQSFPCLSINFAAEAPCGTPPTPPCQTGCCPAATSCPCP